MLGRQLKSNRNTHNHAQQSQPAAAWTAKSCAFVCHCARRYALGMHCDA